MIKKANVQTQTNDQNFAKEGYVSSIGVFEEAMRIAFVE